jgi:hypothetical protein
VRDDGNPVETRWELVEILLVGEQTVNGVIGSGRDASFAPPSKSGETNRIVRER